MGQKGKFLVMEDGQLDLSQYVWDDHRFADILMREKVLDTHQAMAISRFLRQEIETLELPTITVPFIEQLIEAKFREYGLVKPASLRFDKSIFVRNGLNLSENARTVLERRYLKKDLPAQLPHPDECRSPPGPAGGLLRAAGGRQHGRHLRIA
jgi:ribonucleoside-diphosphate reductase alpha chain